MRSYEKIKIYWDMDDVILDTSETLIYLINKRYNIPNNQEEKSIQDLKDWKLRSIYRDIPESAIWEIVNSEEFWQRVSFKEGFISLFGSSIAPYFTHVFVTIGSEENLENKQMFLSGSWKYLFKQQQPFCFIGLPPHSKKEDVDMSDGIQIDDNLKNLAHTNAKLKILVKNFLETDYNTFSEFKSFNIDNLYEVDTLYDIKKILQFILQHPQEF